MLLVILMQSKWMEQLWSFGWIPPPQIPHFLTANPEGSPKDWDDLGHWNKAGRLSSWWCGCLLGNHFGFTPEIRWHPSGCVGRMWSNEPPQQRPMCFMGEKSPSNFSCCLEVHFWPWLQLEFQNHWGILWQRAACMAMVGPHGCPSLIYILKIKSPSSAFQKPSLRYII